MRERPEVRAFWSRVSAAVARGNVNGRGSARLFQGSGKPVPSGLTEPFRLGGSVRSGVDPSFVGQVEVTRALVRTLRTCVAARAPWDPTRGIASTLHELLPRDPRGPQYYDLRGPQYREARELARLFTAGRALICLEVLQAMEIPEGYDDRVNSLRGSAATLAECADLRMLDLLANPAELRRLGFSDDE